MGRFRALAQLTLLISVALTTLGIYSLLNQDWWWAALAVGAGVLLLVPSQMVSLQGQKGSEHELVFVTKQSCTLCDEAQALLPQITDGTPFHVREVDLASDRRLQKLFWDRVPVLLWQGEVVADLGWDVAAVRARLAERLRRVDGTTQQQSP